MEGEQTGLNKVQVSAVVILAVAAIVLTGIAVITEYSQILRTETTTANTTSSVTNGTRTLYGTTGQYPFLQSLTGCVNGTNSTNTIPAANFTIEEGTADGGYITMTSNAATINCTATYLADSTAQASADKFVSGFAIFATFMSVIVLALVGKIIIGLFKKE